MKHGTPRHPKMVDFAKKLGIPRVVAVGTLELLWHATAEFAPRGDIGRHSDHAIAGFCEWDGDETARIEALVACGWLDRCQTHRLVVHDWATHSPMWVKRKGDVPKLGFAVATTSREWAAAFDPTVTASSTASKTAYQSEDSCADNDANGLLRRSSADLHGVPVRTATGSSTPPPIPRPRPRPRPDQDHEPKPTVATSGAEPPHRRPTKQAKIGWTNGAWSGISEQDRTGWAAAFPACDLDRQLAHMSAWLTANPPKARKANWARFIVGWLTKSQQSGGDVKSVRPFVDQAKERRDAQREKEIPETTLKMPVMRVSADGSKTWT